MRTAAVLVAATIALAACSGHPAKRANRAPTTTAVTVAPSSSTGPAPTTTNVRGVRLCATAGLAISAPEGELAAAGHGGVAVIFRNTSSSRCRLTGYPGVAALDAAGRQAAQAERTPNGYIGGLAIDNTTPPVVDIGPGETASALVETTHVGVNSTAPCPEYPAFVVTPPGETHSVHLNIGFSGCTIQVHPVVPGSTGSESR